jgi:hypothetical protein
MNTKFVKECFDYLAETGELIWRVRPLHHFLSEREWKLVNTRAAGSVAGYVRIKNGAKGYKYSKVCGKSEAIHRLVLIWHGYEIPAGMVVDHINQDTHDNRIENLRIVTTAQNLQNQKRPKHNTSGHHGIMWRKERSKWVVRLVMNGKTHVCGHFSNIEDAVKARDESIIRLGYSDFHGKERGD